MYKIFLTLALGALLNAQMIDGVAILVKGEAITLYELKQEMRFSNINVDEASSILIRKKLEEAEIQERKISVTSGEVYDDIKMLASRNNMNVSEFYAAARNANDISSSDLKKKIKEKLLSKKLYSAISYSSIANPSEAEIQEYYELHKPKFSHPSGFKVVIYQSKDQARLQEKIDNPMFNSPDIMQTNSDLPYSKISPELANLLTKTPVGVFTQIIPDGKGGYMSFYMKETKAIEQTGLHGASPQISNMIIAGKREQVLSDYFERLRTNADITFIRKP
ncbi:MAG: peptidylprolyl isomerase [Sulfurimonas sp.]|nr:MAG: peptidylprolyl isomerase [Sulfurimonas sp.]